VWGWGHPTSLLAAPSNTYIGQTAALFRPPLNTHTSNCAALFRLPTKHPRKPIGCPFQVPALQSQFFPTNHRPVCSDQSQTTHKTSEPNKRRPPGAKKKKRPTVPAGSRNTTKVAGKRKANELASSGDISEPATRRPALGDGPSPLPASSTSATGEQAAPGGRQLGSSEGGATYAAVVAAPAAPHKPSGPLKPTAKGSDPTEPAVSSETAPRRMSTDMSGALSGMPVGTTVDAHVTNPCLPAGERPNKTPIFITGVGDTRAFLVWLRSSCPCDLTAQLKAEKLMVVPSTADGFRATICALRSLDGGKGVSFHTFSLPEDRCVRLLVKNLGKGMPESAVREELESLNIRVGDTRAFLVWLRSSCPCDLTAQPKAEKLMVVPSTAPIRTQRPGSCQGPSSHPLLHCVCGTGSGGVQSALSHRARRFAGYV